MTIPPENALVFNTTAAKHSSLVLEIDIALDAGYVGIETTAAKIRAYLDAGHSVSELKAAMSGLPIYGIGPVIDIERHGDDAQTLVHDAHEIFELAHEVGAAAVQVINGPLDFREVVRFLEGSPKMGYRGVLECSDQERLEITARNLKLLSKIAREYGVVVYLEALAWSPVNTIAQQLFLLRKVKQDNLKMVVDFWHCYVSGDSPENVALIEPEFIYGVHVCDSLPFAGGVPDESMLRDVPTGRGVLDLKSWADAVKATGYKGWWSSETFCRRVQQTNSYEVAREMKSQLARLVSDPRDGLGQAGGKKTPGT